MTTSKAKAVKFNGVTVVQGAEKLGAFIVTIAGSMVRIDANIQKAGLSAIHHAMKSGDVRYCEQLIGIMPVSSRRRALGAWMANAMPLVAFADGRDGVAIKLKKKRKAADFEIERAACVVWTEFKPAPAPKKALTQEALATSMGNLLKRATEGGLITEAQKRTIVKALTTVPVVAVEKKAPTRTTGKPKTASKKAADKKPAKKAVKLVARVPVENKPVPAHMSAQADNTIDDKHALHG